jgi:uncharacterized DUF497 family protein
MCPDTYFDVTTVVRGDYEWDADKAASNLEKHGVSFEEGATALQDPHAAYLDASTTGDDEERSACIGFSAAARALYVVHVERGERDRIISARRATAAEEDLYRQG